MTNAIVMNKAWEIARKGQSKFGGKVIEYIAQALKMAWALVKKEEKAKMNKVKLSNFDQFRFDGLEVSIKSNKYYRINRVSTDENKIIVKVADSHLIQTRYGYALILDNEHVVFVKNWQVEQNFYGNEVLLNREYFNVKKWGQHDNFFANEENHSFDRWLAVAKEQEQSGNMVNWQK